MLLIRVILRLHVLQDTSRCSWWRPFCACMFWRTHRDAPDQSHSVPACFGGHIQMLLIKVILCLHVLEDKTRCSWSGSFCACMFWRTHRDAPDQGRSVPACFGGHIEMLLIRVILRLHVLEDTSRCSWSGLFCVSMFRRTHRDVPDQGRSVPACLGGHIEMLLIRVILCLHVLEDTSRCSWSGSFCSCKFWRTRRDAPDQCHSVPACFGGHTEMLQIRVILCLYVLEDTTRCSWSGSFCACMFWRTHRDAPDQGYSVPACFEGHIEMLQIRVILCLYVLEDTLRCSWLGSLCACMF